MEEIYLDNSATTKVRPEVARLVMELMTGEYGNPSSLHGLGLRAQLELDNARGRAARAIGASADRVIFTGSGTESNNLAILGAALAKRRAGKTLVSMAYEHSSVLEPLRRLEREGFILKLVEPGPDGNPDPDKLLEAVDEDTVFLSCMLVNSETGAVAPIGRLVREVRRKNRNVLIHTDASQGLGKLPVLAGQWDVDLLTVSGHKIYAPKGIGCLYVKKGVRLEPVLFGGGQEQGLRPGTQSVPLAAGFGLAAELIAEELKENLEKVTSISEKFYAFLKNVDGLCINSPPGATPYIMNISLPGYRSEVLLHFLESRGIYVSSGSACGRGKPSHVLTSMGLSPGRIDSALRVSFGRYNRPEEAGAFSQAILEAKRTLARSSAGRATLRSPSYRERHKSPNKE